MISRRQWLRWTGGTAVLTAASWPVPGLGGALERLFHGQPAVPTSAITPNEQFYLTSYRSPPTIRLPDWRLTVGGLVERPITLDYAQLLDRPGASEIVTLECIGNTVAGEFISTAEWEGVPVHTLLEEAGVASEAIDVVFHAADGYSDSLTLSRAAAGDVLLARRMNGVPLPTGHGFPARIIVPGLYGMKSVQWLTRIEAVDRDYQGYYQRKGWTDDATVKTMSRIDAPVHGTTLWGMRHLVQGLAFAGIRGIQRVELSFDEGDTWTSVSLEPPLSHASWVFWHYEWEVRSRGSHTVLVRAIDGSGRVQTSEEEGPAPAGITGLHQITVTVVP